MTTPAAERLYLAQHEVHMEGKGWAVYNPDGEPLDQLPVIYGFNNGGSPGWYEGVLLAEDGTYLGGHACSHEGYMPADLGVLEGNRPDRHETFRKHYPGGYRMEFVSKGDVREHAGLMEAYRRNQERREVGPDPWVCRVCGDPLADEATGDPLCPAHAGEPHDARVDR